MYDNTTRDDVKTKVLSDEERRDFDGITIDQDGEEVHEEGIRSYNNQRSEYQSFEGNENFKVYTIHGGSLIAKLIIGLIITGVLLAIIFFGGIYLLGIAAIAVIGFIISAIMGLFF